MTSIRTTLIKRFSIILVITFIFLLSTIVFLNIKNGESNLRKTEQQIRNSLIQKGSLLTFNNSQALQGMAEDNAFSAIRELVSGTVNHDDDIIYGIYMDKQRQAWALADKNNPDGSVEQLEELKDDMAVWANELAIANYRQHYINGIEAYEFAAPIIVEDERLGTIRYGISTTSMNETLNTAMESSDRITIQILLLILFLGVISIAASFIATRRLAQKITKPLDVLTEATKKISDGDYESNIDIRTNNEIGILSHSFDNMRIKTKETLDQLLFKQQQLNEKNRALIRAQGELKDLNQNLEHKVLERTKELREAQAKLVESARAAGVAEVAINVLHNIGNVLNSVNVINQTNFEIIKTSKTPAIQKTAELMLDNLDHIGEYMSEDTRGKRIPELFQKLGIVLQDENHALEENTSRMLNSISMMTNIISTQQKYAKTDLFQEDIQLSIILDETINTQANLIEDNHVKLSRHYREVPNIYAEKAKVYQIMNNLLMNSIQALKSNPDHNRQIDLDIFPEDTNIVFEITDNGVGIDREQQTQIFQHGFTTKKSGHGFGLHSCANLMSEMHGEIYVESDGPGTGAKFKVVFPSAEFANVEHDI